MKILHIDSSILGDGSASRALTREIVTRLKATHPQAEVSYLDLAAQALPHFSLGGTEPPEANVRALEQFLAADVLVIGAPIYNFSIPSQLKAWIDRITVAGRTFRYTANGPEGLAGGKRVIVALARGGVSRPNDAGEFGESYLRFLFGFLGITDLRFVRAEGLAISPQHRQASLEAARAAIATVDALAA
jgi:FMN-dependent NADH-azoreductase